MCLALIILQTVALRRGRSKGLLKTLLIETKLHCIWAFVTISDVTLPYFRSHLGVASKNQFLVTETDRWAFRLVNLPNGTRKTPSKNHNLAAAESLI